MLLWKDTHTLLGLDRNPFAGHPMHAVDFMNYRVVTSEVERFRPDVIINCAALTNVDHCEDDPRAAMALNGDFVHHLAELSARQNSVLVQISTDAVFNGRSATPYTEEDQADPINAYARSKLAGEAAALNWRRALVLRTNIFGWNRARPKPSFGEWLYDVIANRKPATLFTDVVFSPIYIGRFIELIEVALQKNLSGLFHLAGDDSLSKDAFARLLSRRLGRDDDNLKAGSVADVQLRARRARYMGLSSHKFATASGSTIPNVKLSIEEFVSERDGPFISIQ